ncbi:low molecular weight phosphatase family protein [Gillisia hiemivivida]|uniref:Protein-tyrosine-phosphatase n=1 Tax=Gillisia hiemivivida TaxID=291190 RepID=A0A5C6ZTN4_9FLAO|nr:protein-tyrosine-phosphatase [Gillisia hiemivivida]TXD94095.1 protein-tyrosine-phosphatase [Gillisia hiemivivida]
MTLPKIEAIINSLDITSITQERKLLLAPLVVYIQEKLNSKSEIRLNFICTHNSRRSHFSQVWAQTIAEYFKVDNVICYSGGTEATALFPMVAETLQKSGFKIDVLAEGTNPIYSIKYSDNQHPIIGFSKTYDSNFNPSSEFAAIMTCSHADGNCPRITGAEIRIPITYEDPKVSDETQEQESVYKERSLQIATELKYVFSKI